MPIEYVTPLWRRDDLSPKAYVEALLDPEHPDSGLAAQVEIFLGLALEGRPEIFQADDMRELRRKHIIYDLIGSIERGRKLQEQISDEATLMYKAMKIYCDICEAEEWIYEEFNPRPLEGCPPDDFGVPDDLGQLYRLFHADPSDPNIVEYEANISDFEKIDPRVIKPVFRYIRDRLNNRIKIAKNRFAIAGGTSKLGADQQRQDDAGFQTALGDMALKMIQQVPGWKPEKPTNF